MYRGIRGITVSCLTSIFDLINKYPKLGPKECWKLACQLRNFQTRKLLLTHRPFRCHFHVYCRGFFAENPGVASTAKWWGSIWVYDNEMHLLVTLVGQYGSSFLPTHQGSDWGMPPHSCQMCPFARLVSQPELHITSATIRSSSQRWLHCSFCHHCCWSGSGK